MNKNTINAFALSRKLAAALIIGSFSINGCSSSDGSPRIKSFEELTVSESTKGTVTEVEEVEPGGEYKIIDERIIEDKTKSIAIVHALDGSIDTLSLAKMKTQTDSSSHRHSALRPFLMYSMARSFFTNNVSNVTPDSRYYKSPEAYNKAVGVRNDLQRSSVTKTVKVPSGASRGYGSGKSFRSFGG